MEVEESDGFSVQTTVPIPRLPYGQPATTYTLVEMEDAAIGEVEGEMEEEEEEEKERGRGRGRRGFGGKGGRG